MGDDGLARKFQQRLLDDQALAGHVDVVMDGKSTEKSRAK